LRPLADKVTSTSSHAARKGASTVHTPLAYKSTSNFAKEAPDIHQTTLSQDYLLQVAVREGYELATSLQQLPIRCSVHAAPPRPRHPSDYLRPGLPSTGCCPRRLRIDYKLAAAPCQQQFQTWHAAAPPRLRHPQDYLLSSLPPPCSAHRLLGFEHCCHPHHHPALPIACWALSISACLHGQPTRSIREVGGPSLIKLLRTRCACFMLRAMHACRDLARHQTCWRGRAGAFQDATTECSGAT
jgi:hypothetical protein